MIQARLRVFRAPDDPVARERYSRSHRRVLEYFDIGGVTSSARDWFDDPDVLVVVLEEVWSGEVLGGIRLERASGARRLPLERVLSKLEPTQGRLSSSTGPGGAAELCGLFSSRRLRGAGMGRFLTRIGLTLALEQKIGKLFGICDARSLEGNLALGFRVEASRADGGTLRYPRPELTAYVLGAELAAWREPELAPLREFRDARAGVSTRQTREEILLVVWDLRCQSRELTIRDQEHADVRTY